MYVKTKEIDPVGGGGAPAASPLDPPMILKNILCISARENVQFSGQTFLIIINKKYFSILAWKRSAKSDLEDDSANEHSGTERGGRESGSHNSHGSGGEGGGASGKVMHLGNLLCYGQFTPGKCESECEFIL